MLLTPAGFWHQPNTIWNKMDMQCESQLDGDDDEDVHPHVNRKSYPDWMLEDKQKHKYVINQHNTKVCAKMDSCYNSLPK